MNWIEMFTLKILYLYYWLMGKSYLIIKKHLYKIVKVIMQMISFIPWENILADDPLDKNVKVEL